MTSQDLMFYSKSNFGDLKEAKLAVGLVVEYDTKFIDP